MNEIKRIFGLEEDLEKERWAEKLYYFILKTFLILMAEVQLEHFGIA